MTESEIKQTAAISGTRPDARKRLLLVGWDSADWKIIHPMMDRGELPALKSIVEGGVSGNLATLEPQLSPMLWTSIATGKMAYHHGVAGFTEVVPGTTDVAPVSAATRKCKTLWEMLGERGLRSHVVGWFATQGEADMNGCMVSNLYPHAVDKAAEMNPADWPPPPPGTYWPENLGDDLNELRVSPREIDPDQILRLFVPRAAEVDQSQDQKLALLAERLAEAYSIQSAATWLMEERPDWDFMAVYFRAIDEISHIFMPYHPPKMEDVSQTDFEIYQNVVAVAYRVHDLMLQRLMDLAGPDAEVMLVSDHGFHSDHLRPRYTPNVAAGITVWHRPQGIFAARGEAFSSDSLVTGARLLDITPTILHWFGLPVGEDMEGRVLEEIFSRRTTPARISTWETPGYFEDRTHRMGAKENRALLDQFVKLGYIDELSGDPEQAAATTIRENSWNLARAMLYGGRMEEALPLLEDCHFGFPERTDHAQLLARCQMMLGLLDEADVSAATALANGGNRGGARLLQAYIALERRENQRALELLELVRAEEPDAPFLLHYLSMAYLSLRRWKEAVDTAHKMLKLDPTSVQGHLALARCSYHEGNFPQGVESSLDAISHDYSNPRGHYLLGASLIRLEDWDNATVALKRVLQFENHLDVAPARRMLALISKRQTSSPDAEHLPAREKLARALNQAPEKLRLEKLRESMAERSKARVDKRREQRAGGPLRPLSPPQEFIIVSGLPRSGTSLMMQFLAAGGVKPMTDGERTADNDNPQGYYEWEDIKKLPRDPEIITAAAGKATKVISALLPHLSPRHRYKVIFMTRPLDQVVKSQNTMLENRQEAASGGIEMKTHLEAHLDQILPALGMLPNIDLLEVSYPDLVAHPATWAARISEFLDFPLDGTKSEQMVRPRLFSNR